MRLQSSMIKLFRGGLGDRSLAVIWCMIGEERTRTIRNLGEGAIAKVTFANNPTYNNTLAQQLYEHTHYFEYHI